MTVDNLTAVLDSVQVNMEFVLLFLHIPRSKQQYRRGQVNTARADYIIDHHPSPSWMIVANALWFNKAAGALEMVQELYLKGEPFAHSCRIEGRIGSGLSYVVNQFTVYGLHEFLHRVDRRGYVFLPLKFLAIIILYGTGSELASLAHSFIAVLLLCICGRRPLHMYLCTCVESKLANVHILPNHVTLSIT